MNENPIISVSRLPQHPNMPPSGDQETKHGSLNFKDANGLVTLFPSVSQGEAGLAQPDAAFQVLVDIAEVFKNESALEKSIMSSQAALNFFGVYLGYTDLERFEPQAPVLPTVRMTADIVAYRKGIEEPVAVIELTNAPMDTEHVHRSYAYAMLLGAKDAILVAPGFPHGVRTLVDALQRLDKIGVTFHMIRVYAFQPLGETQHHFSFHPLTAARAQSPTITNLENIIRKAHQLGDNSLSLDSIQVDGAGRVRTEAGSGLGTHTFIRVSSHRAHARISVIVKDSALKKLVDDNWPAAHVNWHFSGSVGFEQANVTRGNDSVVAGYNFRVTNPKKPEEYYATVAKAYLEIRSILSHLLAHVAGQITTQRVIPFLPPSGAPQIALPPRP